MIYILLFVISALSLIAFKPLAKATRLPITVFLLLLGIILGPYGILNIFGDDNVLGFKNMVPALTILSGIAVNLLFLNSGIGLDLKAIKESGKSTILLSTIPVHLEGFILGIVAFILLTLIFPSIGFANIPFLVFLIIMLFSAMSSPVIVVPNAMQAKENGKKSKIFDTMIISTIVDAFTPFPLIIVAFAVLHSSISSTGTGFLGLLEIVVGVILITILAFVLGLGIGALYGKIIKSILKEKNEVILWIVTIVMNIMIVLVIAYSGPLETLGIIIAVGTGIGVNIMLEQSIKVSIIQKSQLIFGLFFFPLVFIFVGMETQIYKLFNITLVGALLILVFLAPFVKGVISKIILQRNGFTKKEQKYAKDAFFLKGIILINASVIFGPIFNSILDPATYEVTMNFFYLLAALEILVTIPYGTLRLEKDRENW